jgi:anti-anti-sigma factor
MDTAVTSTTPAPPTSTRPAEPSIVDVIGELDVASAGALRVRIARAAADSSRPIVVELSGVPFVGCAGLGALLRSAAGRVGKECM